MLKAKEGSTQQLLQFCAGYFLAYLATGVTVKYFTSSAPGHPALHDAQFLVYSTFGGTMFCIFWVLLRKWWYWPAYPKGAIAYIIPSGVCTAVVIPTTTMMYMLPISVMVAMVIMRASLIVIGRAVDEIQIRQGILHRKVYQEENTAVLFALTAGGVQLLFVKPGDFDFVGDPYAMSILVSYLTAYAIRIYTMNYYKNTRPKGEPQNNEWFFAIEQIAATVCTALLVVALLSGFGGSGENIEIFRAAIRTPVPNWGWASVAGSFFGLAAFFSVFLFMFKGRTATFANLVNRLTSLLSGTAATLCFAYFFGGKMPKTADWVSLVYILIAVAYLSLAEQRRVAELAKA